MTKLADMLVLDPALPPRLQRSRQHALPKDLEMPIQCVSRPSRWSNPFRVGEFVHVGPDWRPTQRLVKDRPHAVRLYWRWILGARDRCENLVPELAGKALACWCDPPEPGQPDWCHAALLLVLANTTFTPVPKPLIGPVQWSTPLL